MKTAVSLLFLVLIFSESSLAYVVSCQWIEKTRDQTGYRPSGFNIIVEDDSVYVEDEGYLNRTYRPCFDGIRSQCSYDFEIEQSRRFNVIQNTGKTLIIEQINNYAKTQLHMKFSTELPGINSRIMTMHLYGYGGNVSWVEGDEFLCRPYHH